MAQTTFDQHPEWRRSLIEGLTALTDETRPAPARRLVIAIVIGAAALVGWAF